MDTIISYNKKVWGHSLTWSPPGPPETQSLSWECKNVDASPTSGII